MRRIDSLHTFTQQSTYAHEDEGTAEPSSKSVVKIMERAKTLFPGVISAHQLVLALDSVLSKKGFKKDTTLLATSFCCDEVNRHLEDELREAYGSNFNMGGIAGFPFGGVSSFGAMSHHIPLDGSCLMVYGPHIGIDFDGVAGKINRRGHHGSGTCCNTALAARSYVEAVQSGKKIHSPDPSDPIDAQLIFVNSALLDHADRLAKAEDPDVEAMHALFDGIDKLMNRISDKCCGGGVSDIADGVSIAYLGGIQVNTGDGTPEYFLPKKFELRNNKGELVADLLDELLAEGAKDILQVLRQKRLDSKMAALKSSMISVDIKP
uniref:Limiting CO2-inducible protein B/C beta carbonyic anhydrase domain-containing protein n=1 Tax=Eucampia antarctica TaxID=49252 RepID=A0A7S2R4D8_9STRA|mmetsp:Transcript_15500/g.14915  ORF Transcript_15500/g.14915 Transcript_15500/m.14915 type:complete len:321 (+) Transcript_15500:95-1057(+)|eukprot:CAMPEP_0197826306 /NCGR_PEP_ID=MMETSP1437-20131217/3280_1 /TAXON_ID=49252 ORGANISM="Eucampia antarctica, Strain CCMP1452" /NCGR_SAMPLE_ID=MMETSP1437 /ASSEMBLY_ACC=CAM_ASM_001096 /LENGTH=320 /DNA_ID=CAMNT_0043426687 /DNA_START=95 /DNA_END=1057 /DNA_ORIENTATION=+